MASLYWTEAYYVFILITQIESFSLLTLSMKSRSYFFCIDQKRNYFTYFMNFGGFFEIMLKNFCQTGSNRQTGKSFAPTVATRIEINPLSLVLLRFAKYWNLSFVQIITEYAINVNNLNTFRDYCSLHRLDAIVVICYLCLTEKKRESIWCNIYFNIIFL